jgi:hypothetical protein
MSTESLLVLGVIIAPFLIAALVMGLNDLLLKIPSARKLPVAPVLPLILIVFYLIGFISLWLMGAPLLEMFLWPLFIPALILFGCFAFITVPNWIGKFFLAKLFARIRQWMDAP